jgi:hypothetical protein
VKDIETPGDLLPFIFFDSPSFETILDETVTRLWEKKIRYTLRRLDEMEDILICLEEDLEEMIRIFSKRRMV